MKSEKNLETASSLVKNIKSCNDLMNEIVINSSGLINEEDLFILKKNVGEFLGYVYLDIYCKTITKDFPELSGSLES